MTRTQAKSRVRPLQVRPGAGYTCFGDGLCCTDIHALGPLSRQEVVQLRRLRPDATVLESSFEAHILRTAPSGSCVFLGADQRCQVHTAYGPEHKPDGCRRFPLGLVATPVGGRITTDHRCPCRTVGDRPAVTPESALSSLLDPAGRLRADRRAQHRVRVEERRYVPFAEFAVVEERMRERLAAGEPALKVLGTKPFPGMSHTSWKMVVEELLDERDGTQFGIAMAWFADAVRRRKRELRTPLRARPWAPAFARAVKQRGAKRSIDAVLNDWVSDELWSMHWLDFGSFARGRLELATRFAVAQQIADALKGEGVVPEQAAGEAICVVELVGSSEYWADLVADFKCAPR